MLRDNTIGARGVRALANSPHLGRLCELEMPGGNLFGDEDNDFINALDASGKVIRLRSRAFW